METKHRIIKQIVEAGRRMDAKDLVVGTGGNMSVRVGDRMFITASGKCKGLLRIGDITETDNEGCIIKGSVPARDIRMHLAVYRLRPQIRAIVHMHPPYITGFAITDFSFDEVFMPEVIMELGGIAIAEFAPPTTAEVPVAIEKALVKLPETKAVVMRGHGALTMSGKGIMDASFKMELLEMAAKSIFIARIIGKACPLTEQQICSING